MLAPWIFSPDAAIWTLIDRKFEKLVRDPKASIAATEIMFSYGYEAGASLNNAVNMNTTNRETGVWDSQRVLADRSP